MQIIQYGHKHQEIQSPVNNQKTVCSYFCISRGAKDTINYFKCLKYWISCNLDPKVKIEARIEQT